MQRIVVIGLGKLGVAIARTLNELHVDVLSVDASMAAVERAAPEVGAAVQADATDPESLRAAGAAGAAAAIVAIGEGFESCVLATAVLRELGIPRIVARANTDREARILKLVGATEIVFVEQEMGRRLAHTLAGK